MGICVYIYYSPTYGVQQEDWVGWRMVDDGWVPASCGPWGKDWRSYEAAGARNRWPVGDGLRAQARTWYSKVGKR